MNGVVEHRSVYLIFTGFTSYFRLPFHSVLSQWWKRKTFWVKCLKACVCYLCGFQPCNRILSCIHCKPVAFFCCNYLSFAGTYPSFRIPY